jgi:hypothetical protein
MRRVEGGEGPAQVYEALSLDVRTGKVKGTREIAAFGSVPVFATNDAHVIVTGHVTKARFESEPLASFKMTHFAVDGLSVPHFPERSSLVLAHDPHRPDDGLLQFC